MDNGNTMAQRTPLIVVLGATACGKSRLAIELAQRFRGEIISADSMQVYRGLDIVTNKVTDEEQHQARHHMINLVDPLTRFSVVDFRNQSLDIISDLHKTNKVPIVVGGTNYYIESLLWRDFLIGPKIGANKQSSGDDQTQQHTLIDAEAKILNDSSKEALHNDEDLEDIDKFLSKPIYNDAFRHVESIKLWKLLESVDPKAAHLYHMHDKRRIIRSLQIIQRNKRNYSDILENVNKSKEQGKASLGGPLRFDSTCVIWLNCDDEILNQKMDDRVDQMLNRGLLAELEKFHDDYNRQRVLNGEKPQYDKGIFQTIGFKEFHEYFMLDPEVKESETGNKILKRSIEDMKITTRRYARRQLKWVRRRFLQSGTRDLPLLFKLTTCFNEEGWLEQVQKPAFEIVESFLANKEFTDELLAYKEEPTVQEIVNNPGKYECEVCDKVYIGSYHIEAHLKSKSHQKNLAIKRQKIDHDNVTKEQPL